MVAVTSTLSGERAFARPKHYLGEPQVFQVVKSDVERVIVVKQTNHHSAAFNRQAIASCLTL